MKRDFWRGLFGIQLPLHDEFSDAGGGGSDGGSGGGDSGGDAGDQGSGDQLQQRQRSDGRQQQGRQFGSARQQAQGQRGQGQQGRQQQGQGGDRQQGQQQGDGSDTPVRYDPNRRVQLTDGRVVTMQQYEAELASRQEGTLRQKYEAARQMIVREAQRLDALERNRQGQGQGRQQQQDPLGDIRSMSVVDGQTLGRLYDQLQQQGLAPIANFLQQQNQVIQRLAKQVEGFSGHMGSVNEERSSQEFESRLDDVLKTVEIKGFQGRVLDPKSPILREVARDIYLSYDPESWRAGEFEQTLSNRLSALIGMVRELDKKAVETSREKARSFFNPTRGGARPSGQPKQKFQSPSQIAAMGREAGLWGSTSAST